MVSAKELRIENLVNDNQCIAKYVYSIGYLFVELADNEDGDNDCNFSEDEIFGIPLTDKLLSRIGFTNEANHRIYSNHGDFVISYAYDDAFMKSMFFIHHSFRSHSIAIEYVHQLQNSYFALMGKELPIYLSTILEMSVDKKITF
jgi:hypothetical protein